MAEAEPAYFEIPINESILNESGFTAFKLPLNGGGNGKKAKMILWNKEDKVKITYADFYRSDLEKSVKSLEEKLVSEQHIDNVIILYLITYFRNECLILKDDKDSGFFKNGNGKVKTSKQVPTKKSDGEEPPKRKCPAFKYSNKGKDSLFEAVILAGRPVFLSYENGEIKRWDAKEEENRIIEPPHIENYPYEPYEFVSIDEVISYLERAKKETIDSLYRKSKQIASDYNDQNKYKIRLLAIDIVWTYFQDRFPTTHYDIILGSPGSGKSSFGDTFTTVGYRVVNLTDPNAANINRILGTIELGQCTFVSDETGDINRHPDLMALLKTGYSIKGKISKINDYSRIPEYFSTYGFKMIIAEKMPNLKGAKGVHDRSFTFTAFKGKPKYDIKETLETQGNPARIERLDALNDFRKLMLVYRLLHFKDPIGDINVGVEGRGKELSKPIIQLFYESVAQKEVEETLQYFLNQRNEKKDTTLEPVLHPIVAELVSASKTNNEIYVKQIWDFIILGGLAGVYDEKKPNEYQSEDYGTIYRNQIGTILEHTFGGTPRHKKNGNTYTFDPVELARVGKTYNLTTSIQTKMIVIEDEGEDGEHGEGIREEHPSKNEENSDNSRGKSTLKETDNRGSPSIEPSPPSLPSPEDNTTTNDNNNNKSIYRLGHSDKWACKNCKIRDDKWFMQVHECKVKVKEKGKLQGETKKSTKSEFVDEKQKADQAARMFSALGDI